MSMQGLQRAQQLLNVIGQQFPSIAQASEMGVPLGPFITGILLRTGFAQPNMPLTPDVDNVVSGIAMLVGAPDPSPTGGSA